MDNQYIYDFITNNTAYIYSIIKRYKNYAEIEDLYQAASLGIIRAYKKYKASYNVKFTTYAYNYIIGEITNFINKNRSIKLSKEYLKLYRSIVKAKSSLEQKLMKEPSIHELSLFLEIPEQDINDVLLMVSQMDSLDRPICEDGKQQSLYDVVSTSSNNPSIDYLFLYEQLDKLDCQTRKLIDERYFQDKTQQETAKILGINQVQVSRNEKKALKLLKSSIT